MTVDPADVLIFKQTRVASGVDRPLVPVGLAFFRAAIVTADKMVATRDAMHELKAYLAENGISYLFDLEYEHTVSASGGTHYFFVNGDAYREPPPEQGPTGRQIELNSNP